VHKGLAAGVVLIALLAAGCGSGKGAPGPESPAPSAPSPNQPKRSASAKSLQLADKCSVVTSAQAGSLGADQPPRPRDSNGKPGCDYDQGAASAGFAVFVAADTSQTMEKFASMRSQSAQHFDLSGYPAARVAVGTTNCLLAVDVSDQGSLYINTLVPSGNPNPCDLSQKFAQAAVQNLPNG
jgi:hypothetical protein